MTQTCFRVIGDGDVHPETSQPGFPWVGGAYMGKKGENISRRGALDV